MDVSSILNNTSGTRSLTGNVPATSRTKEKQYGNVQSDANTQESRLTSMIPPEFIKELPEELLFLGKARTTKFRVFDIMHQAGLDGDFKKVDEIRGLFHQFGLGRFLPNFTNDMASGETFITRLLSMSPRELASFQRLEERLLGQSH